MSRQLLKIPILERDVAIYLAGLFDGEGSFMIWASQYRGGMKYTVSVRIGMSDKKTIEWIGEKLNRPIKLHGLSRNASPNAKKIYKISLENGAAIIDFVEQILPFLITKRTVASELLSFCKSRIGVLNKSKFDRKHSAHDIETYHKVRALNKFGVN